MGECRTFRFMTSVHPSDPLDPLPFYMLVGPDLREMREYYKLLLEVRAEPDQMSSRVRLDLLAIDYGVDFRTPHPQIPLVGPVSRNKLRRGRGLLNL